MNLFLINPPQFRPFYPPLGIAMVAALARKSGVNVRTVDMNLLSYEYFLSENALNKGADAVREGLEKLEAEVELDFPRQQHYYRLAMSLKSIADPHKAARESLEALRDINSFCRYKDYRQAFIMLNNLLSMSTSPFHPSCVDLTEVRLPIPGNRITPETLMFSRDDEKNPYLKWVSEEFFVRLNNEMPEGSVIGMSIIHPAQFLGAMTFAYAVRRKRRDIKVLLGGPTISTMVPEILATAGFHELFNAVDALVYGEVETAFPEILDKLKQGAPLAGVCNTVCMGPKGSIVKGKETWPADLDKLPTPDFSDVPIERYFSPAPVFPLQLSRGCHWGRCSFCDYNLNEPSIRLRSIDAVLKDITELQTRHGARYFFFADTGVPPRHLLDLADALTEKRIDIRWSCFSLIRPELNEEAAKRLKRGGCRRLMFGVESAVPRILKDTKKGMTVDTVTGVLSSFAGAGIPPHIFLIFGFPGETPVDSAETLGYIERNRSICYSASVELFTMNRSAPLSKDPEAAHVIKEDHKIDPFTTHCDSIAYSTGKGYSYEETRLLYQTFADRLGNILNEKRACYWPLHDIIFFSNNEESQLPANWDLPARESADITKEYEGAYYKQAEGIHAFDLAFDLNDIANINEGMKDAIVKLCCSLGISKEKAVERLKEHAPRLLGSGCLLLVSRSSTVILHGAAISFWDSFKMPVKVDAFVSLKDPSVPGNFSAIFKLLLKADFFASIDMKDGVIPDKSSETMVVS